MLQGKETKEKHRDRIVRRFEEIEIRRHDTECPERKEKQRDFSEKISHEVE